MKLGNIREHDGRLKQTCKDTYATFLRRTIQYREDVTPPELLYKFHTTSTPNQSGFGVLSVCTCVLGGVGCVKNRQANSKFTREDEQSRTGK